MNCKNNQLTSLDVSNNTALTTLNCSNNQLISLDLRKNTALVLYEHDNNPIETFYSNNYQENETVEDEKNIPQKPTKSAIEELTELIGLDSVKSEINTMINSIEVQRIREEKGLVSEPLLHHYIFTGNPGTGKTTVARVVAKIYKELGILKKGHLVETDRSGLVAGYVGQTALQTNKIIDSALDGVLFIDEAYSLYSSSENDYGHEAIATLIKRMEDNRDRLVVILAGYTDKMNELLRSNPGLPSRIYKCIEFPDYSPEELYQIFESLVIKKGYKLSCNSDNILRYFQQAVISKDLYFGNARLVDNKFKEIRENQNNRLAVSKDYSEDSLVEIIDSDILLSFDTLARQTKKRPIGFR